MSRQKPELTSAGSVANALATGAAGISSRTRTRPVDMASDRVPVALVVRRTVDLAEVIFFLGEPCWSKASRRRNSSMIE